MVVPATEVRIGAESRILKAYLWSFSDRFDKKRRTVDTFFFCYTLLVLRFRNILYSISMLMSETIEGNATKEKYHHHFHFHLFNY